jgi:hypothetical protein
MVADMLRVALGLLLVAGVVAPAEAQDPPKKGKKTTKKSKKDDRKPTKTTGSNMPNGWSWPPSKRMVEMEKACEGKLDAAGITWKSAQREGHVPDPISVDDTKLGGVAYNGAWGKMRLEMDCQLALALENIGTDLYALGVREVKFGSIYRWSKVRVGGKTKNVLSRHALGLAMDVVSFVDENGREAVVGKDYKKDDALLLGIEKAINESGKFRLVLTPKNDPISHSDHFHIEANPDYSPALF